MSNLSKIIKGKRYNTASAALIVTQIYQKSGMEERLYRKKTGEYFLFQHGEFCGDKILPLTEETAYRWAESQFGPEYAKRMLCDSNKAISHLSFRVSHSEAEKLKQYALKHNKSQLTVIKDFISTL